MNRRDFLKYLLATPIACELDIEKLLWTPSVHITVPELPLSYYFQGVPYHQLNASTGTWLGFERAKPVDTKELYKSLILPLQ